MLFGVNYLPLLVVLFIAWSVPIALSVLKVKRMPAVVAEMIMGYIIGYFFLGYISQETLFILDFLAILGLMFIMFLSGLEIDVDQLTNSFPRKKITGSHFLKNPLLAGIMHFSLTLGLSLIGSYLLSLIIHIPNIWFFSLILTTTFLGLVLPVLKNRGETNTLYGQMIIVAAAVADVLGIILIVITSVVIRFGIGNELFLIVGLFVIFSFSYHIGKGLKLKIFRRISFQLAHAASQISIRGAMLLLFLFVAISQFLGQEGILLGAFLSGLLLSVFLHKERSLLILKLEGMGYGFFIPVFFIMVGAKLNLKSLNEFDQSLTLILILMTILFYAVKVLPSLLWTRLFGFRQALGGGFLMASRLGLVIAAAFIGMELGAITPGLNTAFILMAVVTCVFSPLLYNIVFKQKAIQDDKTIIVGGSSIGVLLARRLKMHGRFTVIIEQNVDRCAEIKAKGLDVILGDGLDLDLYKKIGLKKNNYIVVHSGSDKINEEVCKLLRHELFHERIISKPANLQMEIALRNLGVEILDSRLVQAATLENLIIRPTTYHSLIESFESFLVEDMTVSSDKVDGKQLKEIPLHKDGMLLLLTRAGEKHIPHGDTYLRTGDLLTVFGTGSAISQIKSLMVHN